MRLALDAGLAEHMFEMETPAPRCDFGRCRRTPAVRLHFGNARADTGDYCAEHAAVIREVAKDPGSLLRGVAREERLDAR